jgi:hypothetical protein
MATIDLSLVQICQQRQKQLLFNFPMNRYNPVSPYVGNITTFQLDMRRKAEILKYTASKSNTKTNNYTKAEKWSLLISGKNQQNTYNDIKVSDVQYVPSPISSNIYTSNIYIGNTVNNSSKYSSIPIYTDITVKYPDTYTSTTDVNGNVKYNIVKGNIPECNTDLIPTPTSSCDVPGPIINLIRDNTIPLYNYNNPTTYGITQFENNDKYSYVIDKNINFNNNVENTLFSMIILNNNDIYNNYFSFSVPLSINFQNNTTANLTSIPNNIIREFNNLNIKLSNLSLNVYYNNSIVNTNYSIILPDISNIDISLNNYITQPFSGSIYIGLLQVSNLLIYTQPGYVYDIKITCQLDDNITSIINKYPQLTEYTDTININKTILFNCTNVNKTQYDCSINSNVSQVANNGFTFHGY